MRDVPHPLATLMQPVDWDQAALDLDGEYWLFTDGREPTQDDKHRYVAVAEHWGYATRDFRWGHNPHMNRPKELAQKLHDSLVE